MKQVTLTGLQRDLLALLDEQNGSPWRPGATPEFCDTLSRRVECRNSHGGVHSALRGLVSKGLLRESSNGYLITAFGQQKLELLRDKGLLK